MSIVNTVPVQPDKVNYILPTKEAKKQRELAKRQESCDHQQWSKRCGLCSLVLESDTQTNVNTNRRIDVSGYQIKVENFDEHYNSGIHRLFELERKVTLLKGKLLIQISQSPYDKDGKYITLTLTKGDSAKIKRDFCYVFQTIQRTELLIVDTL